MLERKRSSGASKYVRISLLVVFVGLMVSVIIVFSKYQSVFNSNVNIEDGNIYLYIEPGSSYDDVREDIADLGFLVDEKSFDWVVKRKGYAALVKPGRYKISDGMSNNELVNMLRAGNQEPVMVVFTNHRTFAQLAGKVSKYIAPDSLELLRHLSNPELPEQYGFTKETFIAMFIPNTYEMYWTSSTKDFTDRIAREYEKFWDKRSRKLSRIGLTRVEVSTLASLVDEETLIDDENPTVAGVYMNRIQMGMPLQSCPTLKFALNDWTITRVLSVYKEVDSPYNTYKHKGLPPGPIMIPSVSSIDGVLNYEDHNYIFMVAKADFSGRHEFSRTLKQHNRYAAKYQRELDRRKIFR